MNYVEASHQWKYFLPLTDPSFFPTAKTTIFSQLHYSSHTRLLKVRYRVGLRIVSIMHHIRYESTDSTAMIITQIFPIINPASANIQVTTMKEVITKGEMSWGLSKFSPAIPKGMYNKQWGEYACWYWGLQGQLRLVDWPIFRVRGYGCGKIQNLSTKYVKWTATGR